jgi:site-specific DNA-adenine methylase
MKIKITGPLFKWFGSKWLSAKLLPNPVHESIIEPFAGSAGYSLRYSDRKVIIAERDPHIFRLWSWLIKEATETLIREIPINLKEGTDIRAVGLSLGQATLLKS